MRARKQHRWITVIVSAMFLITSISFLALWRMHGVQVLSIQTNSMSPLLKAGDAVVTKHVGLDTLSPGDVVSYHNPLHPAVIVTHRIISIDKTKNVVVTKGDNAKIPDAPFDSSLIIGRVSYGLAKVGYILNFLRSPTGLISVIYAPALLIVVLELKRLFLFYAQPSYRLIHYAH